MAASPGREWEDEPCVKPCRRVCPAFKGFSARRVGRLPLAVSLTTCIQMLRSRWTAGRPSTRRPSHTKQSLDTDHGAPL